MQPIVIEIDGETYKQHRSKDSFRDRLSTTIGPQVLKISVNEIESQKGTSLNELGRILSSAQVRHRGQNLADMSMSRYVAALKICHQMQLPPASGKSQRIIIPA